MKDRSDWPVWVYFTWILFFWAVVVATIVYVLSLWG